MAKKTMTSDLAPLGKSQKEIVTEILNSGIEKPSEIFEAIKSKFGIEVGKANINQIKVGWKKAKKGSPARKAAPKRRSDMGLVAYETRASSNTVSRSLSRKVDLIEATVLLCGAFGPDRTREIIAAFRESNA